VSIVRPGHVCTRQRSGEDLDSGDCLRRTYVLHHRECRLCQDVFRLNTDCPSFLVATAVARVRDFIMLPPSHGWHRCRIVYTLPPGLFLRQSNGAARAL
jgi:hypothetical protein